MTLREQASARLKPYIIDRWQLTQCLDALQPVLDALEQEREALRERIQWFEKSGGIAAHTRVFQEMARADALAQERDDLRAKLTQAEFTVNSCKTLLAELDISGTIPRDDYEDGLLSREDFKRVLHRLRAALDRSVTP